MLYEIYEGGKPFFEIFTKDVQSIINLEGISLVEIAEKYNYDKMYMKGMVKKVDNLFWQNFKLSLEEAPWNLLRILLIYERDKDFRTPEEWRVLLEEYFVEQDWLNLMLFLRNEKTDISKTRLSKVLDMHYEIYEGKIPFLEKDIQSIINLEGISLADISEKYGYSEIYIENLSEASDLFWRKLKESLEKDPGELARILSIYEREKSNQPSDPPEEWRKKWRELFEEYFVEQDWLNLMRFLRSRNDSPGISEVLDMHYSVYNGKIPFFQNYIQMVLKSVNDNEMSLSDIKAENGFRDIYVENHDVYYQFWSEVKKSVNKNDIINWETFLNENNNQCGFSHIKKLFLFFSHLNREHLLINQFKFKNCSGFIEEFRKKEWNRLVSIVRQGKHSSGKIINSSLAWWLARVLFLYSNERDSLIKETVSKINGSEWKSILKEMLKTYIVSKSPDVDSDLVQRTLRKVRLVYNDEVESVLCSFFAGGKSLFVIQEHDPKWIMDLFYDLSWSKKSSFSARRRRQKKYCGDFISPKDRNVLLYALSQSLFKKSDFERNEGASTQDLISEVWSVATKIMDLSIKMNDFQESDIWNLSFKALLNIRKEMNEYDFYLQFSDDILELLLSISNNNKAFLSDYLVNHVWAETPSSNYHAAYRGWIKSF